MPNTAKHTQRQDIARSVLAKDLKARKDQRYAVYKCLQAYLLEQGYNLPNSVIDLLLQAPPAETFRRAIQHLQNDLGEFPPEPEIKQMRLDEQVGYEIFYNRSGNIR